VGAGCLAEFCEGVECSAPCDAAADQSEGHGAEHGKEKEHPGKRVDEEVGGWNAGEAGGGEVDGGDGRERDQTGEARGASDGGQGQDDLQGNAETCGEGDGDAKSVESEEVLF